MLLLSLVLAIPVGCGSSGSNVGEEDQPCLPGGECKGDLECNLATGLCERADDPDGGMDDGDADQDGACEPDCAGRVCGDDGCGGTCGSCTGEQTCEQGQCVCASHASQACHQGDVWWFDGCGDAEEVAVPCDYGCTNGSCDDCQPDCSGRECGPDPICGTSCGTCGENASCDGTGQCVCDHQECAGVCCAAWEECVDGQCTDNVDNEWVDSGQNLGAYPTHDIALADVNGDGSLDIITVNQNWGDNGNRVYLNDGSGGFTDSGQSLGSKSTRGLAVGDFDADGDVDFVAGNSEDHLSRIWLNDGNGTFSAGQEIDSGDNAHTVRIASGDLDGNGTIDLVFCHAWMSAPESVFFNNGDATFSKSAQDFPSANSFNIGLHDIDGDGDLDLLYVGHSGDFLYTNDGSGVFTLKQQDFGAETYQSLGFGDFDGDGDADLVLSTTAGDAKLYKNDGSGNYSDSAQALSCSCQLLEMEVADMDGDGDLDLAFGVRDGGPNRIYLNDGNAEFLDSGARLGEGTTSGVSAGDIDGDGDMDLVTGNTTPGSLENKVWLFQ